jgi:hypothetical protein
MQRMRDSMAKPDMVTVFAFKVWDSRRREYVVPYAKRTEDGIKRVHGRIEFDTAELVDARMIGDHGRYEPPDSDED